MALTAIAAPETTVVVRAALTNNKADVRGALFKVAIQIGLWGSIAILVVLLAVVISGGWSVLTTRLGDFLSSPTRSNPSQAGIFQALRGSFWIGMCVVCFSFPIGIGSAIYLEEYSSKGRISRFIDLNVRNLAGVPSVVYGILGFAVFVKLLGGFTGGKSVLAGGLTIAVLVLPLVIITAAEAIRAVPQGIREAGYGVGATRWEVVRRLVLPYAAPGILTGTVLSLARALGEAAPLLLVGAVAGKLGSDAGFFDVNQLREQFMAMPTLITDWAAEAKEGFRAATSAAIVVMLVVVLLANTAAILLRNRYEKKRQA